MARLQSFGFAHDKAQANSILSVSDCAEDTFFVIFADPVEGSNVIVDLEIDSHVYSVIGVPAKTKKVFYWKIGKSKDNTQIDFVDKQPVAQTETEWPSVTAEAKPAKITVSTFEGAYETYPQKTTQVIGVDGNPVKGIAMFLDTEHVVNTNIPKEVKTMRLDSIAGKREYDSPLAGNDPAAHVATVTVKTGQEGVLVPGTVVVMEADDAKVSPITKALESTDVIFILAEPVDATSSDATTIAYQTGNFARTRLVTDGSYELKDKDFAIMRQAGLLTQDMIENPKQSEDE